MIWKGHRFNMGTEKFINSYEGILCLQYALKFWCKINTRKCVRITEINRTDNWFIIKQYCTYKEIDSNHFTGGCIYITHCWSRPVNLRFHTRFVFKMVCELVHYRVISIPIAIFGVSHGNRTRSFPS